MLFSMKTLLINPNIIAVENIRLIHESKLRLYYDLRFIFELVLLEQLKHRYNNVRQIIFFIIIYLYI